MKKTLQPNKSQSAQKNSFTNQVDDTKNPQTINGLWNPPVKCEKYDFLLAFCKTQNLRIFAARSHNEAIYYGGDFALFCPFSKSILFASDSINDIARFLRVEGV